MRSGTIWNRLSMLALSASLCVPTVGSLAASVALAAEPLVVKNEFLNVSVNKQNGRFSITTERGSPYRGGDDNKPLLFQDRLPETSFTTFRIDGKDYVYGNDYGFLGSDGRFSYSPAAMGLTNQSVWSVGGLEITQTLTLVDDRTNPNAGNVKVSYRVKNTTNRTVQVGSRILLDTMLGPVDASPITLAGRNDYIRTETKLEGSLPYYWKAVDNPLQPRVISYGFLNGWGNASPNRMIAAHWSGISETKWDYAIDPSLDFTSSSNAYGTADSAVALYWDPLALSAGAERTYETYYGLGSFFASEADATYKLEIAAPKQLTLNAARDGYNVKEFDILVEIDNTLEKRSVALSGVNVTLGLPAELELVSGESRVKSIGSLAVGDVRTVRWRVKANPQYTYKAAPYQIIVQAAGGEESVHASFVVLPGLSGKLPEVQLLEALPKKLYAPDEAPTLSLQGKGFEVLRGTSDWQVHLVRQRDGMAFPVPKSDAVVVDDKQMSVRLGEALMAKLRPEPGVYTLRIGAGVHGTFEKTIELTNDERYKPRDYGILLVVGENVSAERSGSETGQETYSLVPVVNEAKLAELEESYAEAAYEGDKVVLLEIRGPIRSLAGENPVYEIGSGATINSVVRYDASNELGAIFGAATQKITIRKQERDLSHEGDYIEMTGNGVLSIPGFPFAFGPFGLELTDGSRYALEADEEEDQSPIEIEWDVLKGLSLVQQMGFFNVEIQNAIIGDESVSFGGSVSLSFGVGGEEGDEEAPTTPGSGGSTPPQNGGGSGGGGQNGQTPPSQPPAEEDDPERSGDDFEVALALDEARFGMRQTDDLFGKAGTFGFLGLRAEGGAGLPEGMVPGLDLGASGRVMLDTFDRIFEIEANVEFQVVEVNGLLTLRFTEGGIPIADNFVFVVGGEPGIPLIPTTPVAYITKGGGGFRNMYETLMGNFNFLPPLKLVMVGGMSVAKVVTADNVTLELSLRGVEFSGEFEIVRFPILKEVYGSILLQDSLTRFGVALKAGAKLEIMDVITGEVYIVFEYDSSRNGLFGPIYMAGGGSVAVQIPKAVPIVGGMEIGSAKGQISTENVYGQVKIIGIPFGFKYVWGDALPTIASSRMTAGPLPKAENGLMTQQFYDAEGNEAGAMTFGTNIRRIGGPKPSVPSARKNGVSVLSAEYQEKVTITGQDIAVLEFPFEGDTPPTLTIAKPNGDPYPLVEDENYLVQVISAEDSASGAEERAVYVSILNPEDGDWSMTSNRPLDQMSLLDVEVPASFAEVTAAKTASHTVRVNWTGDHATTEKVSLFLASDNASDPGVLLEEELEVGDGTAVVELPETMPSGTYYIRAALASSGTNLDSRYAATPITIVNPYQPAAPRQAAAEAIGNGLFRVSWETPEAVDGFTLQLLEANGRPVESTGVVDVSGDAREAAVGGMALPADVVTEEGETIPSGSNEPVGLKPGETYRVSVAPYRIVDGVRVYGEAAVSGNAYLPEPDPADVRLTLLDEAGAALENGFGDVGQKTLITNEGTVVVRAASDEPVTSVVEVNDTNVGTFAGASWTAAVPLQEGTNRIEVLSTNEAGDTTLSGTRVVSDTTAPDLKIESPAADALAVSQDVTVKGVAEPGSVVSINGEAAPVGSDGAFERVVPIAGALSRAIVVSAADDAGNETVYATEVLNRNAASIERVELRLADGSAAEEVELTPGAEKELALYGVDAQGAAYRIEPDGADWSVLYGESYGDVTEPGVVAANAEGELVVKASYFLTKDYALEDTIVVKVVPPTGEPEPVVEQRPNVPGGSGGGSEGGGTDEGSAEERIDDALEAILKRLIEREENVRFVASALLTPNEETALAIDGRATLRIPPQRLSGEVGLGVGVLRNKNDYVRNGMKIVGDIYEFQFDKPIRLTVPAELTLRFNLEEVPDPAKAAVYWYNERTETWEWIGGDVNPVDGTIRASLPHFSKYALIYNEELKTFADLTADRWSRDAIYRLVSIGAIHGLTKDGRDVFEPGRAITRQEFLKIAVTAAGAEPSSAPLAGRFADGERIASWAAPYVAAAAERAWLSGAEREGRRYVDPETPISRAEAIALIGRMLEAEPGVADEAAAGLAEAGDVDEASPSDAETSAADERTSNSTDESPIEAAASVESPAEPPTFADDADIPAWAAEHVPALVERGIVGGYPDGTLRPMQRITREEAAAMLSKLLDALYMQE